jgi:hypothetical protein
LGSFSARKTSQGAHLPLFLDALCAALKRADHTEL